MSLSTMLTWCCCSCRNDATGRSVEERVKGNNAHVLLGLSDADLVEDAGPKSHFPVDPRTTHETYSNSRMVSLKQQCSNTSAMEHNKDKTTEGPAPIQEQEKERLRLLVDEFAKVRDKKVARDGVPVVVIDPASGIKEKYLFEMDKYLMSFSLTPFQSSVNGEPPSSRDAPIVPTRYSMTAVTAVCKGRDIAARLPSDYPHPIPDDSVLVDISDPQERIFFVFDDAHSRRKFYTCFKIIRISVEISRNKQKQAAAAAAGASSSNKA